MLSLDFFFEAIEFQCNFALRPSKVAFFFLDKKKTSTIDILTSGTENRGKGNSAKGKEEQKPVTTVALDRVCVRV